MLELTIALYLLPSDSLNFVFVTIVHTKTIGKLFYAMMFFSFIHWQLFWSPLVFLPPPPIIYERYLRCTHIMRVLFCVFCIMHVNPHGEVPPPLHATYNSTFTFYFKYFLRILCTFYLSTFCLHYFLLLLKLFYC
jgi:hypothetical protein